MALNGITFTLGQGGTASPIPGSDYISGYLVYNTTAPSGMTLSVPKPVFSLSQAEALGITNTYSDETAATGTITVVSSSTVGDIITIKVTEPTPNSGTKVVTLCTYTAKSSDTTATLLAQSIKSAINNNLTSGYVATGSAAILTITARAGMGIALNSGTPISYTNSNVSSPGLITISQFSGGVGSKLAQWHYQISEFFRLQPSGKLWIGFYTTPGTYNFTELNSMQTVANGEIRQFMVFSPNGTSASNINADLDAIQLIGTAMFANYSPASIIYAPNIFAISDLTTLPNLRARNDNYVSCVIAQDGNALGATLCLTTGVSIPAMGACLGTVALAKVENDIAWVGKFNITNGTEDEVPALSNKNLISSVSAGQLNSLDSYGYIFLINKIGITGSYWNDSHVACSPTSDYAYIERNRVIGKAQRVLYTSWIGLQNSDLFLNADGTLTTSTIRIFKDAVAPSMNQMVANAEISAYAINIDPTQNVVSTSTLSISVEIVGVGIARNISVQLGFVLAL